MDNFIRKRIDIATCWATNRISAMDTLERYEDSYAIAEEFREWILHIGEKNENLRDSVLNFPKELKELLDQKINDQLINSSCKTQPHYLGLFIIINNDLRI